MISPGKFADVLEASGFTSDAVEVERVSDIGAAADRLARYMSVEAERLAQFDDAELRQVVKSLADGTPMAEFKWRISAELYAMLEEHLSELSASAIHEAFAGDEVAKDEDDTTAAIGGSLINIKKPKYRPISSLALR